MLEVKKISAGYGKENVIRDVSFICKEGKFTVIVGKNGSGKSTLLKCLVGILGYRGEILVSGQKLSELSDIQRAREVAYLPQMRNAPNMSLKTLLLHGRFPHLSYPRKYGKRDLDIVDSVVEEMKLYGLEGKNLSEMSGGQQRKAYIAMALVQETPVILMDEPTTHLDVAEQFKLLDVIKNLTSRGKIVVAVMHDLPLAFKYADELVVVDDGKVLQCGKSSDVAESGIVEKVFGVRIKKAEFPDGCEYCICV